MKAEQYPFCHNLIIHIDKVCVSESYKSKCCKNKTKTQHVKFRSSENPAFYCTGECPYLTAHEHRTGILTLREVTKNKTIRVSTDKTIRTHPFG